MHSKQVWLCLTYKVLFESLEVPLSNQFRWSAMALIPVKELVEFGTLKRILWVPLVLDDLGRVNKLEYGNEAADQRRELSQCT